MFMTMIILFVVSVALMLWWYTHESTKMNERNSQRNIVKQEMQHNLINTLEQQVQLLQEELDNRPQITQPIYINQINETNLNNAELIATLNTQLEIRTEQAESYKQQWASRLQSSMEWVNKIAYEQSESGRLLLAEKYNDGAYEMLKRIGKVDEVWK